VVTWLLVHVDDLQRVCQAMDRPLDTSLAGRVRPCSLPACMVRHGLMDVDGRCVSYEAVSNTQRLVDTDVWILTHASPD